MPVVESLPVYVTLLCYLRHIRLLTKVFRSTTPRRCIGGTTCTRRDSNPQCPKAADLQSAERPLLNSCAGSVGLEPTLPDPESGVLPVGRGTIDPVLSSEDRNPDWRGTTYGTAGYCTEPSTLPSHSPSRSWRHLRWSPRTSDRNRSRSSARGNRRAVVLRALDQSCKDPTY